MHGDIKNTNWRVAHDRLKKEMSKELEKKDEELRQKDEQLEEMREEKKDAIQSRDYYENEHQAWKENAQNKDELIIHLRNVNSFKEGLVVAGALITLILMIGFGFYIAGGIWYCAN